MTSKIQLGLVALNVRDLEGQTAFYTEKIGLAVLSQTPQEVDLGVAGEGKVLVRLIKTNQASVRNYGLFHLAILHPSRDSLAQHFRYLLEQGISFQGGSDHGYSEALYLADPEGNGIELYRDKPQSEWDIREDGKIMGVTEALAAEELLALAPPTTDIYQLPKGTTMGHVHLSVRQASESSLLYQQVLGLEDKMTVPTVSFLASGPYHHHLAVNQWSNSHLPNREIHQPGLNHLTLHYLDDMAFLAFAQKAAVYGMTILDQAETSLWLEDSNGIRFHIVKD